MLSFEHLSAYSAQGFGPSLQVFSEMAHLRKNWANFQPASSLRRSELSMLGIISHQMELNKRPITVGGLSRLMGQSPPGVSKKISDLEKQGYLRRVVDKTDRRVAGIELTKKGREMADCSMREFLGRLEQALERLGPAKTEELLGLMRELSDSIVQQDPTAPKSEHEGNDSV